MAVAEEGGLETIEGWSVVPAVSEVVAPEEWILSVFVLEKTVLGTPGAVVVVRARSAIATPAAAVVRASW